MVANPSVTKKWDWGRIAGDSGKARTRGTGNRRL